MGSDSYFEVPESGYTASDVSLLPPTTFGILPSTRPPPSTYFLIHYSRSSYHSALYVELNTPQHGNPSAVAGISLVKDKKRSGYTNQNVGKSRYEENPADI
jgi:hypothetical protein